MAEAYDSPMPPALDLGGGYTIRLTAIDPFTGNVINGIDVASLVMMVDAAAGTNITDLEFGDFLLVPGPGA